MYIVGCFGGPSQSTQNYLTLVWMYGNYIQKYYFCFSTVALELGRDGKILLRSTEGLEDWFELLEECTLTSKERRRALRVSQDTRKRDNNNSINSSLEEWLTARQKIRKCSFFFIQITGFLKTFSGVGVTLIQGTVT